MDTSTHTYIYIFIYYTRTHSRHSGVGTHQGQERRKEGKKKEVNGKMEEKKDWVTEGETLHPNPRNWCTNWAWRTEGKKDERTKKETERVSVPATLKPSVAFYNPQGSYSEPILVTPPPGPQRGVYIHGLEEFQFIDVILVVREWIWNAHVVLLILLPFNDTGSLGYPPRRMV